MKALPNGIMVGGVVRGRFAMSKSVAQVVKELETNLPAKLLEYARDPVIFVREILRAEPQAWQAKWMRAVSAAKQGLPNWEDGSCRKRFAIRSGTGVGKTSGVSMMILWNLGCFPDAKVPCTAPTSPQIKAVLWPELRKWVGSIPAELKVFFPYEVTGDKVDIHDNFAVARTAREETPEAFQGFHSRNTMLVGDEASGIPNAIYMAGQGAMSDYGALTMLIGNPTRAVGYFFDAFNSDSHLYWTMRVGCQDSERVNPQYIEDMKRKHGENSYEYQVRVLGEFFLEDTGLVIPRPWIDLAVGRAIERDSDWVVWGCDPSDGRDKFGLAKRAGNTLLEKTKAWGGKTVMQSVGMVVDEYYSAPRGMRPDEICVDVIGMGTAFAQRLKEALTGEKVIITRVNVALTGKEVGERYVSRRVELWAAGRDWFESMTTSMPVDDELAGELSSVEWEVKDSNGKWAIVDKAAGGESPARADAFLLTFGGVKGRHKGRSQGNGLANMVPSAYAYAQGSASYLDETGRIT